jgi:hypothetical protein
MSAVRSLSGGKRTWRLPYGRLLKLTPTGHWRPPHRSEARLHRRSYGRRGHSRLKLWPLNARYDPPIGGFCGGLRAGLSVHDFKSAHLIGSISSQARHLETRRGGLPPGASITTIGFPHFGQGLRRASATSWSPSKYKNDIPPNRQVAGVFFISSIGRFALVLLGEPGPLDG